MLQPQIFPCAQEVQSREHLEISGTDFQLLQAQPELWLRDAGNSWESLGSRGVGTGAPTQRQGTICYTAIAISFFITPFLLLQKKNHLRPNVSSELRLCTFFSMATLPPTHCGFGSAQAALWQRRHSVNFPWFHQPRVWGFCRFLHVAALPLCSHG